MKFKDLIDTLDGRGKDLWEAGELVCVTEAEIEDAEGVVLGHSHDGGQRVMFLREVVDLNETVVEEDWISMCMSSVSWVSARGTDTVLWNHLKSNGLIPEGFEFKTKEDRDND